MVLTDMMPLATVERKGFKAFCGIVAPQCELMSRRTLGRSVSQLYKSEKEKVMKELQNAEWLSATADAWSSHKRAFMGVTIHYVDPINFEMKSIALGVRRFKHAHTGDAIARLLLSMLNEFGIRKKVQNIVTDNAANMCKAFTVTVEATEVNDGSTLLTTPEDSEVHLDDIEDEVDESHDHEITENDDEQQFLSVLDALNGSAELDLDEDEFESLPPHKLCGNHTLNLVASSDSLKARDDRTYRRCYDRAMAKVQALSNAVSRSPKMNDIVEDITGSTFINPTCTRWSSDYNAVHRVVSIGLDAVKLCQKELKQELMTEADTQFLISYTKVMKPIVLAMKSLQGEKQLTWLT